MTENRGIRVSLGTLPLSRAPSIPPTLIRLPWELLQRQASNNVLRASAEGRYGKVHMAA